jgi:hypothetical protein
MIDDYPLAGVGEQLGPSASVATSHDYRYIQFGGRNAGTGETL